MKRSSSILFLGAVLALVSPRALAVEAPPEDRVLLSAMQAELGRATRDLSLANAAKPYYVGYWVVDETDRTIEATLGSIVSDTDDRERFVKVELRVGSRAADNSNLAGTTADGDFVKEAELLAPRPTAIDTDGDSIRRDLWLATDSEYKAAIEALERKHATKQSEIAARSEVPSFSTDTSSTVIVKDVPAASGEDPREVARRVSAVFRTYPELQKSGVRYLETRVRRRFVSSDGGLVIEPSRYAGIELSAETQSSDGMSLDRTELVPSADTASPGVEAASAAAKKLASELVELRTAKVAEDYSGPVLFEGEAAAQLVYDLLGDALSGTPPPGNNADLEGPLSRKLGKRILPADFTVVDDPTLAVRDGTPLLGHYAVDDEGIAAERTLLVEDGRLKTFLMSRTPREGVARSNGHGRSGLIGWAKGRVGNLMVTAKHGLTPAAMRARLLAAMRDEGIPSAMVVKRLAARTSASSGEMIPNAELAYVIDRDGKETLVRGAEIAPISVRDLRDILAAGRDSNVYDFIIENEGGVDLPSSVVAPSLLFEDVEVRGPTSPNKRPPVVPRPPLDPARQSLQQRTPSE
jgi:predicted Zn-dependent protease